MNIVLWIGIGCLWVSLAIGAIMAFRGMKRAPFLEDDQVTPEEPFPGPAPVKEPANVVTPDRPAIDHYLAIIQRDEWQEQVYKEIDELTAPFFPEDAR